MRDNPFTPGFGEHPPALAGRRDVLRYLGDAYNPDIRRHPYTRMYLRAEKGVGKTVLLDAAHDLAVERGWLVVEENGGMTTPLGDRIVQRLQRGLERSEDLETQTTVGFKAAGLSVQRSRKENPRAAPTNIRDTVADLLDANPHVSGVLITIDEIHDAPQSEVKAFANEFQHLQRDGYRVAFAGAGLPIGDLNDPAQVPTFLGRAKVLDLGHVHDYEISEAFVSSLEGTGCSFTPVGLARATDASAGLPYAMQLVGWHLVDAASSSTFTGSDVEDVLAQVHAELLTGLRLPMAVSPGRLRFLAAMAHDDGPSRMADVGRRLGRTPKQLSPIRAWLISNDYIEADAHGEVKFVHQGTRALLRTHHSAPIRDSQFLTKQSPSELEGAHQIIEASSPLPDESTKAIFRGWDNLRDRATPKTGIEGPDLPR